MEKPTCELIGADGNIFNLVGLAEQALKGVGQRDEAKKMKKEIFQDSESYDEALQVIMRYVEIE